MSADFYRRLPMLAHYLGRSFAAQQLTKFEREMRLEHNLPRFSGKCLQCGRVAELLNRHNFCSNFCREEYAYQKRKEIHFFLTGLFLERPQVSEATSLEDFVKFLDTAPPYITVDSLAGAPDYGHAN